jgi:hypothetical protein
VEQLWFFGNQTHAFLWERFSKHLREASVTTLNEFEARGAKVDLRMPETAPRKLFNSCVAVGSGGQSRIGRLTIGGSSFGRETDG